jgi:phosphopantothenoylcysteine decarboxylase/phosphopantothenate--cysteine ligase
VLTNLSSGKQGYALAQAALDAGADVILITAPTALPWPNGARRLDAATAEEMAAAVTAESADADVLIMAAAVADFRPEKAEALKIKKESGLSNLRLEPTRDILSEVSRVRAKSRRPKVVVGFAAETNDLESNAMKKLHAKGLDLIAANDILDGDSGFTAETNRVVLIGADGKAEALPLMSKYDVADRIFARITPSILAQA